jgi:hypothetical protein
MPSKRKRMTRQRRSETISPAEMEWLTGAPQEGANRFELLELKYLTTLDRMDRAAAVLDRAAGVVPAERIAELRAMVDARRAEHRRMYRSI